MIQRIQTVFMLISAALMLAMLAFPLWIKRSTDGAEQVVLGAFQLLHSSKAALVGQSGTYAIGVTAVLSAIVSIYAIFQYKKRRLQITLCGFNVVLICSNIGLVVYYVHFIANKIFSPEQYGAFGYAFFFPVIAVIFSQLASRFAWRDEKMVRDSERLR